MRSFMLNTVYVNPLTDFGFALVFAQDKNKDLLIHFLNAMIGKEEQITDIEYLPINQFGYREKDRKAVFDIYCKNEKEERFIVEMQRVKQEHFVDRSLFYSAFPILKQAPNGKWDFNLKAVYTIAILDFALFDDEEDPDYCPERIYLTRERTKEKYSDKLNLIFVELPKFTKREDELKTNADYWIYSLKHAEHLASKPAKVKEEIFDKLFEILEINQLTESEMETYNKSVLEYRDVRSALNLAKRESFEQGIEKGIARGIEQGRAAGIKEGVEIIAKKCLKEKIPLELISKLTSLAPEQLINL